MGKGDNIEEEKMLASFGVKVRRNQTLKEEFRMRKAWNKQNTNLEKNQLCCVGIGGNRVLKAEELDTV